MSASSIKLTKEAIEKARAKPGRYIIWDTVLPGYGLRIEPSGVRTFFIRYRPKGLGRKAPKRFLKLGRYGPMTPDEARNCARQILGAVAGGDDPAAELADIRDAVTVAILIEKFIENWTPKLKPGTSKLYRHYLNDLVAPEIGKLKAHAIVHADIEKLHLNIGRTRKVAANRTLAAVSTLFEYGLRSNLLPPETINPARRIKKFHETARDRYLSKQELERLGAALHEAETDGVPWDVDESKPTAKHIPKRNRLTVLSPFATAALRLLLFTGCRLREVLHLRWSDVDIERGMLHLRDSKTGKKTVILNAPALAVLVSLTRISEFVIAGDDPTKPRSDLKRPWSVISKRAGLDGVRLHDLRHSFASVGAGAGLGLPIVGRLLGHASPTTTARYAHLDADPLRRASNAIGATIEAALAGRSGEVTRMRRV
jgi:integrase